MSKGNPEVRFRCPPELDKVLNNIQCDLGLSEKTAGLKLLLVLGDDKINDIVNHIDSITHPLSETQFEQLFISLKIRVKQLRDQRKKAKKVL